ncbi:hypothetical protein [Armatimonas sp.]|uniref:hypothetical protein n=1 Tax=Armatimonas sp. TaxID=1872638 RepID=UPI00374DDA6A
MMRTQLPLPTTAALQTLEPEEAILLIHRKTAPHARRLHCISIPWHIIKMVLFVLSFAFLIAILATLGSPNTSTLSIIFGILLICVALFLPFAFVVQRLYNFLGNRRADQLMEKLKEPLAQCRLASVVPELLDFVVWLESSPLHVLKRPLHDALVRLLPRVGEVELVRILTPVHQKTLRRLCRNPRTHPDLVKVALLALGSLKDEKTIPIARRLVAQRRAVADAAEAFLDAVR